MTPIELLLSLLKHGEVTLTLGEMEDMPRIPDECRRLAVRVKPYNPACPEYGVNRLWTLVTEQQSELPLVTINLFASLHDLAVPKEAPLR